MTHAVGSLVRARGREWVVLPESEGDLLLLRPLGGSDREIAGLYLPLEGQDVQPATFDLPDPQHPGDYTSCRMLRDAARLGFRSSAGPFRSFGRVNVEPRPYQMVPLLMALKLDPIRLLIADDVGIGKTIEAALIAREMLDRAEVRRLAVLCPPHLAEQWQRELREKFGIEMETVLSSTVSRLERDTAVGQSLFDIHPFVAVSTDYIKSARRRAEFVRTCPELVIVDEAHTCAASPERGGGRQQRHQLLRELAADPHRHVILVTATPHSGDEGAFRSLLSLLRPDFAGLPQDLSGPANERQRREVARHLIQRRRADVRAFMREEVGSETTFPAREEAEHTYRLTEEYRSLFNSALAYARERVADKSGTAFHQRVRWWSALALLRSLASSPAAAASTLRMRSSTADTETEAEADLVGEQAVLDLDDLDAGETIDATPGSQEGEGDGGGQRERLLRLARTAEGLRGPEMDAKLRGATTLVRSLVNDGYQPILFCRFIATAEYVAEELRKVLPSTVEVAAVTGTLPPAEREERVRLLGEKAKRVLVATDCLSEGINLQDYFNAVVHYDLSWNPTRHEQREGRVDRFGQPSPTVRTLTYYGADNLVDSLVLRVLLRKHTAIRNSLGISVPVPATANEVVQALMRGLMLQGSSHAQQLSLFASADDASRGLHASWDRAADREKQSRTLFAQRTIDPGEVVREWNAMRSSVGTGADVRRFLRDAVLASGGAVRENGRVLELNLKEAQGLRQAAGDLEEVRACFELPAPDGAVHLMRTHPLVEAMAGHVLNSALDPLTEGIARRCGVARTKAVQERTTLLLVRLRYHILATRPDRPDAELLAEDLLTLGFTGSPAEARWLPSEKVEELLSAAPAGNIDTAIATRFLQAALDGYPQLEPALEEQARERGEELLRAHQRVRDVGQLGGRRYQVRPQLPPDLLGVYVLLPSAGSA